MLRNDLSIFYPHCKKKKMSYEFDEVKLSLREGRDWWETLKKVPLKIVDQDFGIQVKSTDLVESIEDVSSSGGEGKQEAAVKVLDIDNLKLKEGMTETSYSEVRFDEKDWFTVEIATNHFKKEDFRTTIKKGFLHITAVSEETLEGGDVVWRRFDRRYMLPHDYYACEIRDQTRTCLADGRFTVKVCKGVKEGTPKSGKSNCGLIMPRDYFSPVKGSGDPRSS